jgi:DNA-binding transcriptional LysR family regulator
MLYIQSMNLNNIDLNLLRCLVVLVEEASVSKTASRLEMSQPAISHCLKKLRDIFNDPLLVRVGSKMSVTPRGHAVADEAKTILQKIDVLIQPPQLFNPLNYEGNFTISSPEYVDHRLTPKLIKTMVQLAPQAHLLIRPPAPGLADKNLESGELDVRIGWVDKIRPDMRSKTLYTEKFVCVARKKHPKIKGNLDLLTYVDALHVRSQVSMPSTASRSTDQIISQLGFDLNVALVVPSLMTIGKVVSETDLIATIPAGVADFLSKMYSLDTYAPPIKLHEVKVAMYWHEKMQSDKRHTWLRTVLTNASLPFRN